MDWLKLMHLDVDCPISIFKDNEQVSLALRLLSGLSNSVSRLSTSDLHLSSLLVSLAFASESDHRYQQGEPVTLWVNKVGPCNNPQETYNHFVTAN
ncbi:hypothetical protein K1719_005066 [Acacia pycnantha]|nr:hypothetical protein K1719_005066 [Acacia pycnantha]